MLLWLQNLDFAGGGAAIAAEPEAETGGLTRRQKARIRRYLVEIDGQFFDADSIAAVQAQLAHVREIASEAAERDAAKAPTDGRTGKIRIRPPRVKVTTAAGNRTTSVTIQRDLERTQKAVNRIYRQASARIDEVRQMALARELRARNKRAQEKRDEEAIIALLF